MASTEEQLKQVLAKSNGKVHKSVLARTLRISMGYLDAIGDFLKRKEEITISGGWYTIAGERLYAGKENRASCKSFVSVVKGHKIPLAAMSILVLSGALFGGSAVRSSGKRLLQIPESFEQPNVAEASSSNDASSYQDSKSAITTNDFHFTVPITRQYKLPRAGEREKVIEKPKQALKMNVAVTFYSSTPDQTDNTPLITANGKLVRDGIAASNFLALGTRIKLPELFGDKHFVIEDRMHSRFTDRVDVWVPTREEALNQGISFTTVEIY